MSQFAAAGVAYAAEAENQRRLHRKIKYSEFSFACRILSNSTSTTLTMGEFILLEFMRLGRVDADQIDKIRDRFLKLDKQQKGELSLEDLERAQVVVIDKHTIRQNSHIAMTNRSPAENSLDANDSSPEQSNAGDSSKLGEEGIPLVTVDEESGDVESRLR
jgi:hypothetical protein